jgi:RHS repeat-associated protein
VLQDWTYDPLLDRPNDTHDYGRGTSATYTYDAFDRVATEDDKSSGGTRHSDFDYLGLSDRVSQERHSGRDSDTKDFSYDAWGDVVGMKQTGTNAGQYTFGYDEHGSVSQLIDQAGQAKAAYGYTPYGDQDKQETVGDTTPDNPLNPYRYDEKRFDPGSGTLDMGARRFDPATGRFLQADLYKGALDDLDLATDPLTSNRYSLAGGNPINFVEIDGHWPDFVDHAIDKVKKVAKGAIHAVAGAARYCLGSGARTCATIAGTVALASTGVGLAAGVAGAATLATAATATATTASLTSSALSFNSYRRTGSKMDLVNGALGLADAGALGSATVSSARTLSRTKGIRRLMDESPREFDKVGIGRFAKRSQAGQHDYADDAQRAANRGFLREDGCHTCGVRSGSAVADHQPARALNEYAGGRWVRKPYRFYPQCRACSNEQGTQVKRLLERARARSWQRRLRDLWYR